MLREPDDMYGPDYGYDEEDIMFERGYVKKEQAHHIDYIGEELNRILMAVYKTGNVEEIVDALDCLSGIYKHLDIRNQEAKITKKAEVKTNCDYINWIASITRSHCNV